jgi:hypothetical protein
MIISNHYQFWLHTLLYNIVIYGASIWKSVLYLNELLDFVKADSNINFFNVPDFEPTIYASLTFGMLVEIYSRPY